jgi:DNA-binding transcriptional LysR family regulator
MDIRHLRYIVAVAEELNFGRAAIRLNISQPPLSLQIRNTEEELGVKIFHRNKRQVRLTEAGERIVAQAYEVLGEMDRLTKVAVSAGRGEIGHLSVGALQGVMPILVDALSSFTQHRPNVHVDLEYMCTGEQLHRLREGRIDVGFLSLPVQDQTLAAVKIKEEPLRLALPKNHPLARFRQVPMTALAGQPFIFFPRRATPGLHDLITGLCRTAGFSLNVVHEVESIVASLTLVRANLGIAFSMDHFKDKSDSLVFRPLEDSRAVVTYGMVYKRDEKTPVMDSFISAVREATERRRSRSSEKSTLTAVANNRGRRS